MFYNLYYKPQLLVIFASLAIGCNQNRTNDVKGKMADTTSIIANETDNTPSFDSSRRVTIVASDLYKQLADSLNIRIVEGSYKPGDSSAVHSHPDYAVYVLEGSTMELTLMDGTKRQLELKKGMTLVLPAVTHSSKNIGKTTFKFILVEVNRPRD